MRGKDAVENKQCGGTQVRGTGRCSCQPSTSGLWPPRNAHSGSLGDYRGADLPFCFLRILEVGISEETIPKGLRPHAEWQLPWLCPLPTGPPALGPPLAFTLPRGQKRQCPSLYSQTTVAHAGLCWPQLSTRAKLGWHRLKSQLTDSVPGSVAWALQASPHSGPRAASQVGTTASPPPREQSQAQRG